MLKSNIINQSTGQINTSICNNQLYDENMDYSTVRKRHDDEILKAYLEYEEFMSKENNYRSAA